MRAEQQYIDLYRQYSGTVAKSCGEMMNLPREEAFASFEKLGFPNTGLEEYRNCDMNGLLSYDYGMNLNRIHVQVNPHDVFSCDVPNLSTKLFFVVNDQFYKRDKAIGLPEGVFCGSLNEFGKIHKELLAPYYSKLSEKSSDGMVPFNTSFVQDGLVFYVPSNVKIEKPIQLIQVLYGHEDIIVQRRILVILEEGAKAKLLFCDHSLSPNRFLSNQVSEIFLGKGSSLEYYELEMGHSSTTRISNTFASLDSDSAFLHNGITLSNGFTRNNINVHFNGEHSQVNMSGLALGDQNQLIDNHIFVDHATPNCTSNELYKYVLDGSSRGIFGGRVLVRKDAQKTVAYQSNKNLCSTREARMFSKPQLEIYADDVKCSHGSATGQIDDNKLFYLRSRGISESEARLLLKHAFTSDVIDRISLEPLRDRMRMLVEKRFRGELARCAGCAALNCM
jgi:Fe-S cluster assembly protein SufD